MPRKPVRRKGRRFPWASLPDEELLKLRLKDLDVQIKGTWLEGCLRDLDGNYRITGRVDDVLNVSGHRIGTAEVENAINMHTGVIESAVVGYPHDIKGQGIYAYVILDQHEHEHDQTLTMQDISHTVSRLIGPIAKPDKIQFVSGLPKTRSGKIMRRILRKIAEGETQNLGDTSTLLDPSVVDEIKQGRI